jgi:hypothetical protein
VAPAAARVKARRRRRRAADFVLNVWNFGKGGPGSVAMTKTKLRVFVSISTFDGEGVENTVDHGSELFYRITLFVSI